MAATKQAKYESKKLEVLRAAARVFSDLGYHGATINDVANELGATAAGLYHYVDSKDELLSEVSRIACERLLERLSALKSDKTLSGLEKVREFLRYYAQNNVEDFGRCLALTNPDDVPPPFSTQMTEVCATAISCSAFRPCRSDWLELATRMPSWPAAMCSCNNGRTYGRKQPVRPRLKIFLREGAVHIWTSVRIGACMVLEQRPMSRCSTRTETARAKRHPLLLRSLTPRHFPGLALVPAQTG